MIDIESDDELFVSKTKDVPIFTSSAAPTEKRSVRAAATKKAIKYVDDLDDLEEELDNDDDDNAISDEFMDDD